ncbi:MAG: CoB--CoM heterodisulfide reductase iron-sulfur subunit A family protein [Acidobacteria bacterium]|nr:CoB--CoM heterodisulfide reductase iron-sulfur subunit A family protein [Acidobacteriota bacterium]
MNDSDGKLIAVIGGGISGMTTALEAAEAGHKVLLVEQEPFLGGRVARNSKYYPKLCPPSCGLEINFKRLARNPDVRILTMAKVAAVAGGPGNWELTIRVEPRFVNEKCTACGKCAEACETMIPNPFNLGLDQVKGAYLPHPMAFPLRYVLAPKVAAGPDGAKCKAACTFDAVNLDDKPQTIKVNAASVVVATGWKPYDPAKLGHLGYGTVKNVVTNAAMERLASPTGHTGGKIVRPSDGGPVTDIAFAQCAGSRDENHLPYCSGVCCMATLKQAVLVREQYPDATITIHYIDVRAMGKYETFYAKLQQDPKVTFVRGVVAKVSADPATGDPVVESEDSLTGKRSTRKTGMLVLATGIVPAAGKDDCPLPLDRDEFGFVTRRQSKHGLHGAGCASRPNSVAQCVQEATGAALKAIQDLAAR